MTKKKQAKPAALAGAGPRSEGTALDALAEAVLDVLKDRPSATRVVHPATATATATATAGTATGASASDADAAPPAALIFEEEAVTTRFLSGHGSSGVLRRSEPDRRVARRVSLEVPVTMRMGKEDIEGTTEDISTSGLFVRISRLIRSGRRLSLRFDLPHGVIEVTGVVVRFRTPSRETPGGVGVCFQALTTEQVECIEAFCDASDSLR